MMLLHFRSDEGNTIVAFIDGQDDRSFLGAPLSCVGQFWKKFQRLGDREPSPEMGMSYTTPCDSFR